MLTGFGLQKMLFGFSTEVQHIHIVLHSIASVSLKSFTVPYFDISLLFWKRDRGEKRRVASFDSFGKKGVLREELYVYMAISPV